ncbi:ERF family protein [Naasia lichenicola]|uniref:Uncharacterized protein n=1 Tax=Naasia lichenicola TaxID=2565933 RepID=A0A4S4FKY6_9MICO|nr:ERF family protein [Naasia lichenicola]THG30694.1 hypothetical protein E6C64_08620 [Naasia lichenicola]THG31931.1 hypothetical protein E6C64_07765 [Naasia lichenicola]
MASEINAEGHELIAAALVKVQGQIPNIAKSKTAGAGTYAYKYADLGSIWEAIRKPLTDAELAVTQFLQSRDNADWMDTTIWHASGQSLTSSILIPLEGKKPQDVGSIITYYKRYALGAALGIATEEDDDAQSVATQKPSERKAPPAANPGPSDEILDEIRELSQKLKLTPEQIRKTNALIKTEAKALQIRDEMKDRLSKLDIAPPEQTA